MRRLRTTLRILSLAALLAFGAAHAQEAPAPVPQPEAPQAAPLPEEVVAPAQEAAPAAPAVSEAISPAPAVPKEVPTGPAAESIVLNFKDASLDAVLSYLSEAAGLAVLREVSVEGRVTLMSAKPLSVDEAVTLLNSVLKEKGYAAVRMNRILKIVTLEDARRRNIPVRSGSDPTTIEPSDEVITHIIPLRSIDAVKLKADLAPLIPATANVASNAAGNALIVTDTSANVRRIAEIVRALDGHRSTMAEVKVFPLKYANAASAARLITEIFREDDAARQRTGGTQGTGRFVGFPGMRQPQTQQQEEGARGAPRVTATADDRTNTVVVTGPADSVSVAEAILKELDANPAEEQSVQVFSLRNAKAASVQTVLNNLFNTSSQARTTGAAAAQRTTTQRGTSSRQTTTTTRTATGSTTAQALASGLAGDVYTVADVDTNSIMVMTSPKNFDAVRQIINELDRAVPQVLIKVLVAEVTHDNTRDLGVEFSALNLRASGRGPELLTDFGVADQSGGMIFRLMESDFTATLRALERIGKLDVLSRPYILASDNQLATITVGQEVPFVTNTRTTDTGQTINTVEYRDIGIILRVTPHINPEGLVIMDVNPEITALTGATVPISEVLDAAVYAKRSAQSRVSIRDGQTIVIGGLIEDRKTETISQVPLLGRIPVLGRLFKRTTLRTAKTELLIFLTPQVATEEETLRDLSVREEKGLTLVPEAVLPGTFDAHMKNMRSLEAPQSK